MVGAESGGFDVAGLTDAPPRGTVAVNVLGPVTVTGTAGETTVGGLKQRTVFGLLVASAGRPVSADWLIDGVYGDGAPDGARRTVQTYVSNLRRITDGAIEPTGSGYRLAVTSHRIDAARFESEVDRVSSIEDADERSAALADALAIWRGFPYADTDAFHTLPAEITRLDELRLATVERRVDADLERGHHVALVGEVEALADAHPLREHFRAQHMLALYRSGRSVEAVRVYTAARQAIIEETGLDPSPELAGLADRIRRHDDRLLASSRAAIIRTSVLVAELTPDVRQPGSVVRPDLVDHFDELLTDAAARHGGEVFAVRGAARFVRFLSCANAAETATEIQLGLLHSGDIAHAGARIAIDVGDAEIAASGATSGPPVRRAALLAGCAHLGQIVASSDAVHDLTASGGNWIVRGLGVPSLPQIAHLDPVHQISRHGLPDEFPPLLNQPRSVALPHDAQVAPGYEIRERVAIEQGSTLHRGYQPSVGREVAVRVVAPERSNQPDFIRRFELDAQSFARLEHPHVVSLLDYWRDPGGAYLVTPWLSGGSLSTLVAQGPLPLETTSRMLDEVGDALATAHRVGLVHGGLTAADVLIDASGNFMLGSLGHSGYLVGSRIAAPADDVAALAELVRGCVDIGALPDRVRAVLDDDIPASVDEFRLAWVDAVGKPDSAALRRTSVRNPYRGLDSFREPDAGDFHGRDELSDAIARIVEERPLVALVGPSGTGKSSVMHAGALPRIRALHADWFVVDLTPGADPLAAMAAAIGRLADRATSGLVEVLRDRGIDAAVERFLPSGARVLFLVDQFEELFTVTRAEDDRRRFLELLHDARAVDRLRIVVTLRADYFDRPLRYGSFGELFSDGVIPVHAPTDDQLRSIIIDPALAVGVRWDRAVVERMVADVRDQPGALPILEFALTRLFEARTGEIVMLEEYEAIGGVIGAMVASAEGTFESLQPKDAISARQLFLRLVAVDADVPTRRRGRITELSRVGDGSARRILEAFERERLITFDRDLTSRVATVQLAHEALIERWPRLVVWIDESRADLPFQQRLTAATAEWHSNDEAADFLLPEGKLIQHESWVGETNLHPTPEERRFLDTSRDAIDTTTHRYRRRQRRVIASIAAIAVIATMMAVLALIARRNAVSQAAVAEGRRLLASASATEAYDPGVSLLLAVAGAEQLPGDRAAASRLHESLAANRTLFSDSWPGNPPGTAWGAMSTDGSKLVWAGVPGNVVEVRSVDSGAVIWRHVFDTPAPQHLRLNPLFAQGDAAVAVFASYGADADASGDEPPDATGVTIFDANTGDIMRHVDGNRCGFWIALGGAGWAAVAQQTPSDLLLAHQFSQVAIDADGCRPVGAGRAQVDVVRFDVDTGAVDVVLPDRSVVGVHFTSMSADGRILSIDPFIGDRTVVDIETGEVLLTVPDEESFGPTALNADGSLVAFGAEESHRFEVYSVDSGDLIVSPSGHVPGSSINAIGFTADGRSVHSSSDDATVRLWDVTTGAEVATLAGAGAPTSEVRVSDDGRRMSIFTFGPQVRVLSLEAIDEVDPIVDCPPGSPVFRNNKGLLVRGDRVLTHAACDGRTEPSTARIVDTTSGEIIGSAPALGQTVGWSADGKLVVAQDWTRVGDQIVGGPLVLLSERGKVIAELNGICEWNWGDIDPFLNGLLDFTTGSGPQCAEAPDLPFGATNWDIDVAPDGSLAAVTADSQGASHVLVIDLTTGAVKMVVAGADAAFSPNSTELAVFDLRTGEIVVYDLASNEAVRAGAAADQSLLVDLVYVDEGSLIAARSQAGLANPTIFRFDASTLALTGTMTDAHEAAITHLTTNSDGTLLASAGADGFAKVWDARTGTLVHEIQVTDGLVQAVALSDDGRYLHAVADGSQTLTFIIEFDGLVAHARERLTRPFTDTECLTYFAGGECPALAADLVD